MIVTMKLYNPNTVAPFMSRLALVLILSLFCGLELSAQTSCTDCVPCEEGGPCCNVWNACNYNQSVCYSNTGCPSSTIDSNGCDLACTPIDSGLLFLLFGATVFGSMLLSDKGNRVASGFLK